MSRDQIFQEVILTLLQLDPIRLIQMTSDLNMHQRYCKIAQRILDRVFKRLGIVRFVDTCQSIFEKIEQEEIKEEEETTSTVKGTRNKRFKAKKDRIYERMRAIKRPEKKKNELAMRISEFMNGFMFYSQKHLARVDRIQ